MLAAECRLYFWFRYSGEILRRKSEGTRLTRFSLPGHAAWT